MIEYFYEAEFKAFNENDIRYLVIGGIAVNLYGLQRLTRDLDLMIDLSANQLEKFIEVVTGLGYFTKVPQNEWPNLTAVCFRHRSDEMKSIDVFLKNPIDFSDAYSKKEMFNIKNKFKIAVVSLQDLLTMKDKSGRVRDWVDIGSLKRMRDLKEK
ncbi:MAG: hypothetical protein ABIE84_04435 [bacterium]